MAHQENTDPPAHAPAEEAQNLAGYTSLPNLLLQELGGQQGSTYSVVLFIARHTIGRQIKLGSSCYRVKTVCLSFDEFLCGRRKRDGTRMQPPSGLSDDKAVMRGCQAALAQGLIEVGEVTGTRGVRLYSIPARFWRSAGFATAIQMLADPRVPSYFAAYRLITLDEGQGPTAGNIPADRTHSGLVHASTAGKIPADAPSQPLQAAAAPVSTAGKSAAVVGQNASSTAVEMPADISDQPVQEAVRGERKHRIKHRKLNIDRTFDTKEVQNEMLKKLANTNTALAEEPLRAKPDQPAVAQEPVTTLAQRGKARSASPRLRASAQQRSSPEAEQPSSSASPDRQAPGESTGLRLRPPPDHAPLLAGEDAADLAARRLRLLALQQELAQLTRTPSMQLLARQRIPRLEEAIKHLIISLAESAWCAACRRRLNVPASRLLLVLRAG